MKRTHLLIVAVLLLALPEAAFASEYSIEQSGAGWPITVRQRAHELLKLVLGSGSSFWYWCPAVCFLCLSLLLVYLPLIKGGQSSTRHSVMFLASLVLLVFALRWPGLVLDEQNPDESQAIATALKLWADPFFWRSVDGTTHGPLFSYPLLLGKLVGLPVEYGLARLLGLCMLSAGLVFAYFAFRRLCSEVAARVSCFSLAAVIGSFTSNDFMHYSSEHPPLLLLFIALWSVAVLHTTTDTTYRLIVTAVGGACLGLIPFAKLQAVPIAFVLGIALVVGQFRKADVPRGRLLGTVVLCTGGLFPALVFAYCVWFSSSWDTFWNSYILGNLAYANRVGVTFADKLGKIFTFSMAWMDLRIYALASLLLMFFGVLSLPTFWRTLPSRSRLAGILSVALLCATLFAIAKPGNSFPHYLLFLLPVFGLMNAFVSEAFLVACTGAHKFYTMHVLNILLALLPFAIPLWEPQRILHSFNPLQRVLTTPLTETLSGLAGPGESMAVWGWAPKLFILTDFIPATRDIIGQRQIEPNPQQTYFIQRFIKDLRKSKPPIFVDVTGPNPYSFGYRDKEQYGITAFPDVLAFVQKRYTLFGEVDGVRIYTRLGRSQGIKQSEDRRTTG